MKTRNLRALQDAQWPWSKATFPNQTVASNIAHLRKELGELEEAASIGINGNAEIELADCQLLLINIMSLLRVSAEAHIENCYTKLAINKQRKWGAPAPEGHIEHIRDDKTAAAGSAIKPSL